jgi:hypothetical protein
MSNKPTPELETFLLFDEMLILSKELEDPNKFAIFASLKREFEEQQLLNEINKDEDASRQEADNDYRIIREST